MADRELQVILSSGEVTGVKIGANQVITQATLDAHDVVATHREINDVGTLVTELFSAAKIIAGLATKSATTHDHDADYDTLGAAAIVQGNLDTHTGEVAKHRIINDLGTLTTELFSASKLITLLAAKGNMFKSAYDINSDDVVDGADEVDGVDIAGNSKYYGTSAVGAAGFHDLPSVGVPDAHAASHEVAGADLINHDNLTNYDANDHIDHTTITFTAGTAMTGGGTLAANRTFNVTLGTGAGVAAEGNHAHAGVYEPVDATIIRQADVDDIPVNGVLIAPISSNWAYDHNQPETHYAQSAITEVGILTAGNVSAAVPALAITYAKIQNISATDKLLGRSTAGAGSVEEITCTAAGRALLDDADAAAQRTTLDALKTDATGIGGGTVIDNIVSISQTSYDAIGTPDAATLYIISGA